MGNGLRRFLRGISGDAAALVLDSLTGRTTPPPRRRPATRPTRHTQPGLATARPAGTTRVDVWDFAERGLPAFSYTPFPDGNADPGEVVWTWVPYEDDPARGKDRPVLVLARSRGRLVVAQLTSKDHSHGPGAQPDHGRYWMDIGTGGWDRQGRPSEVRLDRLLLVAPGNVRREGAGLTRQVYRAVVDQLRALHS